MFNKQIFKLYRLSKTAGNKTAYDDTGEEISGELDPLDVEVGVFADASFGKSFRMNSRSMMSTVKETDRLVNGNDQYEVRGVQKYNHPPKHLVLVLEKQIKK